VQHYPLFVPWSSGARIHRENQREIVADRVAGFGQFQESFTSQGTLDRPRQVLVRAVEAPLERLTNTWTLTPARDATPVDLIADFQLKNHVLDHVDNGMFHEAAPRLVSAFESRVLLPHMMWRHATQHPSS
jgi:coenzyme Q-binding protein COQ10